MTELLDEKDYSGCFYTYKDGYYRYEIPARFLAPDNGDYVSIDISRFKPKDEE